MKRLSVEEIKKLVSEDNTKKFYDQYYWRHRLRPVILQRDNYECQHCKKEGKVKLSKFCKIDVNHIKPLAEYPHLAYDESNLEAICVYHHNIADNKKTATKKRTLLNEERW